MATSTDILNYSLIPAEQCRNSVDKTLLKESDSLVSSERDEKNQLTIANADLQKRIDDLERKNLDLQKKNNDQELKLSDLSSSLNSAESKLSTQDSQIAKLRTANADLQRQALELAASWFLGSTN